MVKECWRQGQSKSRGAYSRVIYYRHSFSQCPLTYQHGTEQNWLGYLLDKETKINHLFHVDDLKLYATSDSQLTGPVKTVKKVSDDSRMNFGLDKCAKATFKAGKKVSTEYKPISDETVIQELDRRRHVEKGCNWV